MKPFYTLSDEDWRFFEDKGYLGVLCWGGFILCKPGYRSLLVDNSSPEVRTITEPEADVLVTMLRGGEDT